MRAHRSHFSTSGMKSGNAMDKQNNPMITPAALAAAANGDLDNFVVASTPGGIEAQERAGQITSNAMATLPIDMGPRARTHLESLGFEFGEQLDDLFIHCKFPAGWRKQGTEHAMHSDLLDDKGRRRGSIFYKAAFYDRKAYGRLLCRYSYSQYLPCDAEGNTVDSHEHTHYKTCVTDADNPVHLIAVRDRTHYKQDEEHAKLAQSWLDERYPDRANPLAYWD
jgi:hypothetical protein